MIKYLKEENLKDEMQKEKLLIDFYADWCGPCKALGSVLETIDTIDILKINTDEHQDLAHEFGVMSIPTLLLVKDGNVVKRQIGMLSKSELESWLNEEL